MKRFSHYLSEAAQKVSAVRKVVDFFARLLSAGLNLFLEFLGVEPEVMEYTW